MQAKASDISYLVINYLLTPLMLSVAEIYISYGKKEILDYYQHYIFIDNRLKQMYYYDRALHF